MTPTGTSRCGRRHSSAVVVAVSKPMYEKKTSAAAGMMPWPPPPLNGLQRTPALRHERRQVGGMKQPDPGDDEDDERRDLQDDEDVVRRGRFADADDEQHREREHEQRADHIVLRMRRIPLRDDHHGPWKTKCDVRAQMRHGDAGAASAPCSADENCCATGAALMPYSKSSAKPMIHATSCPSVAYAYVYALPAIGTIAPSSAYDERCEERREPGKHERDDDRRPASCTPGPIVVKMPPPIIVPRPTAIRSRARSTRRSFEVVCASARIRSIEVVANRRRTNDAARRRRPSRRRGHQRAASRRVGRQPSCAARC